MFHKEKRNYRKLSYFVVTIILLSAGVYAVEVKSQLHVVNKQVIDQVLLIEELGKQQHQLVGHLKAEISNYESRVGALSLKLASEQKRNKKYRSQYNYKIKKMASQQQQLQTQTDLEIQKILENSKNNNQQQVVTLPDTKSELQVKNENEKRVDELMAELASLKVNLDVINRCDKEYLARHGQAKSLLSHMRTYIQQYKMSQEYHHFIISNDVLISRKARELCIES
ncbi:MAG: hypothetical protein GY951_04000 [Psychromonas sp.]|nr:hypothetical protein [Alteromonadales bacterium]MCP5077203.1 hypothetical protein [Psychromonas sp.]